MLTTIAGKDCGYGGDGKDAPNALLSNPACIAYDKNGFLYIADNGNNRVRKIYPWAAAVEQVADKKALEIYPNPGNGTFTLKGELNVTAGVDEVSITVTDLAANIVYRGNARITGNGIDTQITLDSGNIANGTYLVVVKAGIESLMSHLVVER